MLIAVYAAGCAPSLGVAPRLVASWPSVDAPLPVAKQTFELSFNRPLDAGATWAEVVGADDSVKASTVAVSANDPRRLSVRLQEPGEGSFDLHWHAVAVDSHLATDGHVPFAMQRDRPAPARIDVSPPTAESGDRLELVGKGFPKNASVPLTIGDDDQPLVSAETDASGRFNLEAHVPKGVPYGLQRISSIEDGDRTAQATVQVQWGGWPPVVASNVGTSGPDAGEVTFTIDVSNRSDYVLEHVRVAVQDPEDAEIVSADAGAQHQGSTLAWEIPVLDRGVASPLHVTYRTDHTLASHASLEFRHRRQRGCELGSCLPAFVSDTRADSEPTAPR